MIKKAAVVIMILFCMSGCGSRDKKESHKSVDTTTQIGDVNIHIKDDSQIVIKDVEEYKEVKYISARGDSDRTSFNESNSINKKLYWDSKNKILKIVNISTTGETYITYREIIACSYVEIEYVD